MSNTAVFGIFNNREDTSNAVDRLRSAGFRNTDISALLPENVGTRDFAHEKNTKGPKGTAEDAASGVVVGGALGWLEGIGPLAVPGLGPFIAAGPIMAAMAGAGAATGGLTGVLMEFGASRNEAKRYEGLVRAGKILFSVHCDNSDWVSRAKEILEANGAHDVASSAEAAADFAKSDNPMVRSMTS